MDILQILQDLVKKNLITFTQLPSILKEIKGYYNDFLARFGKNLGAEDIEFAMQSLVYSFIKDPSDIGNFFNLLCDCCSKLSDGIKNKNYLPLYEWCQKEKLLRIVDTEEIQKRCKTKAEKIIFQHFSGNLDTVFRYYSFHKKDGSRWTIGRFAEADILLLSNKIHGVQYATVSYQQGQFELEVSPIEKSISHNFSPITKNLKLNHHDYIGIENDQEIILFKDNSVTTTTEFTQRAIPGSHQLLSLTKFISQYHELFQKITIDSKNFSKLTDLLKIYSYLYPRPFYPSAIASCSLEGICELILCYIARLLQKEFTGIHSIVLGYLPAKGIPLSLINFARTQSKIEIPDLNSIETKYWEGNPIGVVFSLSERIAIMLPLLMEQGNKSFLYLELDSEQNFEDGKLKLVPLVANAGSIAAALKNAIIFKAMEDKGVLESEIENAEKNQKLLYPTEIPSFKNLSMCSAIKQKLLVGGDYFDIIPCPNESDSFLIVIGDAMGHGVKGALIVATVRSALRTLWQQHKPMNEILSEVNKIVSSSFEKGTFMQSLMLKWDANCLKAWNAGFQCKPLIMRKGANSSAFLDLPKNLAFGLPRYCYEEFDIPLNDGDTLLLYTDGIEEAQVNGQILGKERLQKIFENQIHLPLEEMIKGILQQICELTSVSLYPVLLSNAMNKKQEFTLNAMMEDDLTLIAIRKENPSKSNIYTLVSI